MFGGDVARRPSLVSNGTRSSTYYAFYRLLIKSASVVLASLRKYAHAVRRFGTRHYSSGCHLVHHNCNLLFVFVYFFEFCVDDLFVRLRAVAALGAIRTCAGRTGR